MESSSTEQCLPSAPPRRGVQPLLREWANGFVTRPAGWWNGWRTGGWRREFAVAGAAGIVLGLLGPFGSFLNGPLPARLAYWVAGLLLGTVVLGAARHAAARMATLRKLPFWPTYVVATMLASVPIAFLTHACANALWSGPIRQVSGLTWYAETLVISALLPLIHALAGPRAAPAAAREAAEGDFLARLPPHLGRDLLALQMEDHYVRAHTRLGSALILIPLHQAIRELRGVPGLKIHRSWWVARHAVAASMQDGRNIRLRLANGLTAPVARASVAEVRAAGLLERKEGLLF